MSLEQLTVQLMESLIRREETKVAEVSTTLCLSERFSQWQFFRCDSVTGQLRQVWPRVSEPVDIPLDLYRKRLEKGEVLSLEKGGVLVDNDVSGSNGKNRGGWCPPNSILVPLVYQSKLQGILRGFAKETADDLGEESVSPLRPQLRLISQTWHLFGLLDERERLVHTDRLTGLHNAEYLLHFLGGELARCSRYGRSCSIAFLDVDWFKKVNDEHGHMVGSHVLHELGCLLKSSIRDSDVAVRYGGDEFVLVLTETGEGGARALSERLRQIVQGHEFNRDLGRAIRLTVSIGISVFPDHASNASELIHQADLAMYVAKHSHKNCIRVALK